MLISSTLNSVVLQYRADVFLKEVSHVDKSLFSNDLNDSMMMLRMYEISTKASKISTFYNVSNSSLKIIRIVYVNACTILTRVR